MDTIEKLLKDNGFRSEKELRDAINSGQIKIDQTIKELSSISQSYGERKENA